MRFVDACSGFQLRITLDNRHTGRIALSLCNA
jgi:hypothetical protein